MRAKIIIFLVFLIIAGNVLKIFVSDISKKKIEIDESELILKEKKDTPEKNKIDINKSEYEDFIFAGFSKSQAEKLVNYKDFTGDVGSLEELPRIKGFGKASIEKANKLLYVSSEVKYRNKHNINNLDEDQLKMLGFTNKEIKILLSKTKKQKIRTNIDLIDIMGLERYNQLEKMIKYTD